MGKYALLIGVDTYGKGLQPLPAASQDVAALRDVLLNPQMGGFDEVKLLLNPTQPVMAREIELWFQDRQPEDLVLLFFSGHGLKDNLHDLYFAATTTEKQRDRLVHASAISARFIDDCMRGCPAKHQVLILDCCFSGAFGELVGKDDSEIPLQEHLGAEGRVVLTSTSAVDYSFEEKGTYLSFYTRYLVEGMATGAADEDEDGLITLDELHRYAARKVKEASPGMSPKLITLKDEGFRIRLAHSPQDDPKLKDRKEALDPHLSKSSRITGARWTRQKFLKVAIPLGIGIIGVSAIGVFSQREDPSNGIAHEDPFQGSVNIDYSTLESLLQAGDWRRADQETLQLMLQLANQEKDGYLGVGILEKFPCEELQRLDDLWVKYSNGKFGFSVQAKIWQEVGSPTTYNEQWDAFENRVGWQKEGTWVDSSSLLADPNLSLAGEFPLLSRLRYGRWWRSGYAGVFFSRIETCGL